MSDKTAVTSYPLNELIKKRWSPRSFSDKPVEQEKILALLEAARWAPSCYNEQPWFFIVTTKEDPENYKRLFDCLVEGNQVWAKTAPVLMLSVAKLNFTHNDKPNRHAQHDVGLAVENLVLEALSHGIYVHQMAGFDSRQAQKEFQIPQGFEPVAAIALGYPGASNALPEDLAKRENAPRTRKELTEFVFQGNWGEKINL